MTEAKVYFTLTGWRACIVFIGIFYIIPFALAMGVAELVSFFAQMWSGK